MVVDADRQLQHLLRSDPCAAAEWAADQKLANDPRITRIGRFLRQSSLDELPQLFNVLSRQMSLVGPRPIVAAEVPRYGRNIEYYYETKPGITGLWQVSGRNDTGYARRVRLDVWYVRNWSLSHDVAILCKTVPAVFLRRGGALKAAMMSAMPLTTKTRKHFYRGGHPLMHASVNVSLRMPPRSLRMPPRSLRGQQVIRNLPAVPTTDFTELPPAMTVDWEFGGAHGPPPSSPAPVLFGGTGAAPRIGIPGQAGP